MKQIDKIRERICDGYCKYPLICKNQEDLEGICNECPLGDLDKIFLEDEKDGK